MPWLRQSESFIHRFYRLSQPVGFKANYLQHVNRVNYHTSHVILLFEYTLHNYLPNSRTWKMECYPYIPYQSLRIAPGVVSISIATCMNWNHGSYSPYLHECTQTFSYTYLLTLTIPRMHIPRYTCAHFNIFIYAHITALTNSPATMHITFPYTHTPFNYNFLYFPMPFLCTHLRDSYPSPPEGPVHHDILLNAIAGCIYLTFL